MTKLGRYKDSTKELSGQSVPASSTLSLNGGGCRIVTELTTVPLATSTTVGGIQLTGNAPPTLFLREDGTWQSVGTGSVDTLGTPVDNQVAVFTDANTIEGHSGFTYDSTTGYVNTAAIVRTAGVSQHLTLQAGNASGAAGTDAGNLILKAGNAINADSGSTAGKIILVPGNHHTSGNAGQIELGDSSSNYGSFYISPKGIATDINLQLSSKGSGGYILLSANGGASSISLLSNMIYLQGVGGILLTGGHNSAITKPGSYQNTGYDLSFTTGNISGTIGDYNSGNIYIYCGNPLNSGTRGNIYFGTGSTGYLPAKTTETNSVFYDTTTGKLSYGVVGTYTFQHSLTEAASAVNLVNDAASPGNSKLYGTNSSGTRGWYDIPTAGVPSAHNTTHENGGADEISVAGLNGVLADAQTPISHAVNASTYGYGDGTVAGHIRVGTGLNVATGTISVAYGSSNSTACVGNDSRLSNNRTPVAHQLDSATYHTVSGLTNGHFLRATSTTSFGFVALAKADVEGVLTGSITSHTHPNIVTTNFSILQESGKLVIKYGSTVIASITSAGLLTIANDVVAYGTP